MDWRIGSVSAPFVTTGGGNSRSRWLLLLFDGGGLERVLVRDRSPRCKCSQGAAAATTHALSTTPAAAAGTSALRKAAAVGHSSLLC